MSATKKITTNVNKDAGLMDIPSVKTPRSKWINKHTNYVSFNAGEIYPVYCEEVVPHERKTITMAMLSHMTTPKAPLLNAMYTELRAFFVPHRISADLLAGYSTRKSPYVKVFGDDNAKASANIVVPLADQKLPDITDGRATACANLSLKAFGGLFDALDLEPKGLSSASDLKAWYKQLNFLSISAYELIYQSAYRNQNRESSTESKLYQFLFNSYSSTGTGLYGYDDSLHVANREKDYYTGAQPFTQKGDPVSVSLLGEAPVIAKATAVTGGGVSAGAVGAGLRTGAQDPISAVGDTASISDILSDGGSGTATISLVAKLSESKGVDIEQLRLMVKTQEMLEKDMMYGSDYASYLNAHFGVKILKGFLDEPQEIKKTIITSQMQAVLQSSSTDNEPSILGSIGANATTQSGDVLIVPETFFPEYGYLIICAVHKTQNVYDALYFKPKHIFKKARFDFFASEIEDLGYQKVDGREFGYAVNGLDPVAFNEAFAEYRYSFNKCHAMLEPGRSGALSYWTTAMSNYADIQTLYKQGVTELNRAIAVNSTVAPQFFDAYGFIEVCDKPMKLHSIPGMDAVI